MPIFKSVFNKIKELVSFPIIIYIIFAIGFLVRLWGIRYGFPLQLNVDEPSLISSTLGLKNSLNPGRFDWPHLYFYINAFSYLVFSIIRKIIEIFIELPESAYSAHWFFLISRLLSVIFGSITIFVIYRIGKLLYSHRVGVLAALIIAFLPVHVYESHLAKIDVAHTFFVSISVYYMARCYKFNKRSDYLWTGFWLGISTTVKYNSFMLFLPLLLIYIVNSNRDNLKKFFIDFFNFHRLKWLILSGVLSVVVFFIGTPYAIIDFQTFISNEYAVGLLWQFSNVGKVPLEMYQFELYETFFIMYKDNLGYILWIVFLLLIVLFTFFNRRSKKDIILILPVLILSFYISRFDRSPSHYFLILIPFYTVALAIFIIEFYNKYIRQTKPALIVFILLILSTSIASSVYTSYLFARTDTRETAYNWVQENLDENNDFLFVNGEELGIIPFKKNETLRIKKVDRDGINYHETPFYVVIGVEDVEYEDIMTGKRDPAALEGNSEPILKDSELMLYVDNKHRLGPPIYLFKINSVEEDKD